MCYLGRYSVRLSTGGPLNACGAKDKHLFPENKNGTLLCGDSDSAGVAVRGMENGGPLPESGSLWLQDEAAAISTRCRTFFSGAYSG